MRQISLKQIGLFVAIAIVAAACGKNSAPPLDDATVRALAEGDVEFELSVGGQPSYWWLLSAE